jgi:hypothetical protein
MPIRPALPPRRFDKIGAGLEPKNQYGKPFRRDPAATELRFQTKLPLWRLPTQTGKATIIFVLKDPLIAGFPQGNYTLFNNA